MSAAARTTRWSHGLQLQSLWITPTAAVSEHVFAGGLGRPVRPQVGEPDPDRAAGDCHGLTAAIPVENATAAAVRLTRARGPGCRSTRWWWRRSTGCGWCGASQHGLSLPKHGPNHLEPRCNALPAHRMARITSGCVRPEQVLTEYSEDPAARLGQVSHGLQLPSLWRKLLQLLADTARLGHRPATSPSRSCCRSWSSSPGTSTCSPPTGRPGPSGSATPSRRPAKQKRLVKQKRPPRSAWGCRSSRTRCSSWPTCGATRSRRPTTARSSGSSPSGSPCSRSSSRTPRPRGSGPGWSAGTTRRRRPSGARSAGTKGGCRSLSGTF